MNIVKWLVSLVLVASSTVSTENIDFLDRSVEPPFDTENVSLPLLEENGGQYDTSYVFDQVASVAGRIGARGEVSVYKIHRIIYCESRYRNVQSNVWRNGVREDSWGVAQIHLPSHPEITKEQALDVEFSVNFVAQELLKGNGWKWYGYNPQLDKCN